MTSSLAAQLAHGASLNATLLVDRSRRKLTESYLFTGREADHHDLYSLHALGLNALLQLKSLNPDFRPFEDTLFSDASKTTDRTLLQTDRVAELNENISKFTGLLGPYLMEAPAGKALEWLVRRFRINEFNIDDTLALFLPYHESPHFAKMVTLLHIKPQSKWHFLLAHKSAAKEISRSALVTEMLRNTDLTRFVVSLLPESIKSGHSHRTLIAFHTSTVLDYISRTKSLDEGTLALLLPSLLEVLQPPTTNSKLQATKDAILSSYILLSALSQKLHFSQKALRTIVAAVAKSSEGGLSTKHVTNTILSVCAPQTQLEKVPSSVIKVVLTSSLFKDALVESLSWAGSEKFVNPLLTSLIGRLSDPSAHDTVHSILASQSVPPATVCAAVRALLQTVVSEDVPITDIPRKLLGQVRLRHPDLLQTVAQEMIVEDGLKEKIEQIVMSLSLTNLGTSALTDEYSEIIVATSDADPNVRGIAVRKLLESLSSSTLNPTERAECQAAILARISDTDASVITILYSHPSDVLPFLDKSFLDLVRDVLCLDHSSPSRQIVRLHLTFLTNHFVPKFPALAGNVVKECLWPFLMFSKPRHKTTAAVWEVLESEVCSEEITKHELLGGCLDAVRWEEGKDNPPTDGQENEAANRHSNVDTMARVDLALANRIADNVLSSNQYATYLDFLLRKLQDQNCFSRTLGYLVTRALLSRLSGEHQIDAAHRVLGVMDIDTLEGMDSFMFGSGDLQLFSYDKNLGAYAASKPSSNVTTNRLKISILAMIPQSISRPMNVSLDWFGGGKDTTDTRGVRYVDLMCSIYRLANSTVSLPAISAHLIRTQFMSLKDDALAFLAAVWTSPPDLSASSQNNREYQSQQAALHHAAAFLLAHHSTQNWVDFQTILPLILYALESPSRGVREAAMECVVLMDRLCEAEKPVVIYGFDTIYGENSGELQYLEWTDLRKYIRAIIEHRHHLTNDPSYMRSFQQQCLMKQKSDTKKESAYKRRILCYLLSHVKACCRPFVKLGLLRSLKEVSDRSKIEILLSTAADAFRDPPPSALVSQFGPLFEEFVALLVSSFDYSAAKALNDSAGASWLVFSTLMKKSFSSGSVCFYREILTQNLEHGLFKQLMFDRQVELCQTLLELGTSNSQASSHCKSVLANVLQDIPLVLHLIGQLQPLTKESAPPAAKRARLDIPHVEAPKTETLGQLTLLAEVLSGVKTLENSIDVISGLLDTLNNVVHCGESGTAYLEQLLMSILENLANKILTVNIAPNAVKLDVLVEIIRVSDNPQTFHQALLLMSSFARLAPEAVLRNVMPIFTFMGSNILHRDDAYSFKVVQKTVDNIVPVMVSSLEGTHPTPLELHVASRKFLAIFTDAANHIPRHRRTSFFSHFVDVLGADHYLAPVCMLLVDKVANRVARQSSADAHNSLTIALSLIQHYPSGTQMDVLIQVVQETQRIIFNMRNPEKPETTFLDNSQSEDDVASVTSKRRAQALIIFADDALKQMQPITSSKSNCISELVTLLLGLSSVADPQLELEKITAASRVCLTSLLNILPVGDFVSSILVLVEASDEKVQVGALDLFGEQLLRMTEKFRREATPSVNKIIKFIIGVLSKDGSQSLTTSALTVLKSIGDTVCAGEENVLGDTIPLVLTMIKNHKSSEFAMSALASISIKLGPRIISHFRKIVQECVRVTLEELTSTEKHSSSLATDSLKVLQGLLSAIPSFWASEEINPVVDLYLSCGTSKAAMTSSLMKNLAKRVPSNVLLPTLCESWTALSISKDKDADRLTAFFNLLKKSLHAAARPDVLQHLRPLYNVFLQAFTLYSTSAPEDDKAEQQTIAAFLELVVKLNDTAFKPLFRKLYDWAFTNDPESKKQVVFCRIYIALLDFFKGLMTPYMSYMTNSFTDLLKAFTKYTDPDPDLWTSLIETLAKTFQVDEGAFWRDEKLRSLASPLIQQIPTSIKLAASSSTSTSTNNDTIADARKSALADCISGLAGAITDDTDLLKSINLQVLMQSRSEDPKQRIFALDCAQRLWRSNGEKLLGFVAETGTFIAELAEDDNDTVVRETRKFKSIVETVAGSIDNL